jgi:hypothetical protein
MTTAHQCARGHPKDQRAIFFPADVTQRRGNKVPSFYLIFNVKSKNSADFQKFSAL